MAIILTEQLSRRAAPQSGLSQQTVIIIAVSVSVGGVALLLLLFRFLRSYASPSQVPLPPIQPLAHHRSAKVNERPNTLYEKSHLTPPRLSLNSSRVSLFAKDSSAHSPSMNGCDDLSLASPLGHSGSNLPLPGHLAGLTDSPSASSFESFEMSTTPPPQRHPRASSSDGSHARRRSTQHTPSRASRAPSVSSAGHGSLRGTPHSRHSQVQIILPAPLSSLPGGPPSRRSSMVDPWAPHPVRHSGMPPPPSYVSPTQSNSTGASKRASRRVSSIPTFHYASPTDISLSNLQDPASDSAIPPPVPPIPSIYNTLQSQSEQQARPRANSLPGKE